MPRPETRSAVLLGATGAVGQHVFHELLRLPAFAAITTLGRRPVDVTEGEASTKRLAQHVVALDDPTSYRAFLDGHTSAICTLGVGQPSKVTREELWKTDVDYVMGFASACREAGVHHFSLMTTVGADPRASYDYLKMKGTLEERVKALGFPRTTLFRPSMLLTPQNRYGLGQGLTLAIWPKLDGLFAGPLRQYRGIRVADLGRAIALDAARDAPDGVEVFTWDGFQELLRGAAPA